MAGDALSSAVPPSGYRRGSPATSCKFRILSLIVSTRIEPSAVVRIHREAIVYSATEFASASVNRDLMLQRQVHLGWRSIFRCIEDFMLQTLQIKHKLHQFDKSLCVPVLWFSAISWLLNCHFMTSWLSNCVWEKTSQCWSSDVLYCWHFILHLAYDVFSGDRL